jgi:purine-binding chemotaxis protein CheW
MAEAQAAATPRSDFCIFMRDGRRFALSTAIAKEVLEARPFTPVPYAPRELIGAFNLRGEVVPLVNLDRFLAVEERPASRGDTLLLLCHGDLTLAAVVDHVVIIKHVSPWEIRRARLDPSMQNPFVRGLIGRDDEQSMVLDGERLLAGIVEQIAAGLRGTARAPVAAPEGSATRSAPVDVATQAPRPETIAMSASDGGAADEADLGGPVSGIELPVGGR